MAVPRVPQIPAQVPQVSAPPPPAVAPRVLQRPLEPNTMPTPVDRDAMTGKTMAPSASRSTSWRTTLLRERDQLTFTMATTTIALFLVVLMFVVRENIESSTTDADFGATSMDVAVDQTTTKETTARKPPEPTSSTQNRKSSSVKPSPPETTPTEIPKTDREPLVCTVRDSLISVAQFPPDKMCDYIFFDSLYKDRDRNLLPNETTYSKSLNVFLNDHRDYRHTTLGLGFAFK
ncbi:hypothetical protein MTO96_017639 [Rhipicephalus appendiculatus]